MCDPYTFLEIPKVCVRHTQVLTALMVRDTAMAATLPVGLYDDIMDTLKSMVSIDVTISECNAVSFVGYCKYMGTTCHIRVSSQYMGVRYFLTLTHEIAHLLAWVRCSNNIKPHGKEWKDEYRSFVLRFLGKGYFSAEMEYAINIHMANPPHSAKLHTEMVKVLNPGVVPIKEIQCGSIFRRFSSDLLYVKTAQKYSTAYFRCVTTNEVFTCHKDTMVLKNY